MKANKSFGRRLSGISIPAVILVVCGVIGGALGVMTVKAEEELAVDAKTAKEVTVITQAVLADEESEEQQQLLLILKNVSSDGSISRAEYKDVIKKNDEYNAAKEARKIRAFVNAKMKVD